jgi:hypothetical protein
MARNSLIRAGGVWSPGTEVEDFEFEALDAAQHNALSETGGSWAPGEAILLSGSFGLWSQRLRAGNDVGGGVPIFDVNGTAISTHPTSSLAVGGALSAPAASMTLTNAGYPARSGTGLSFSNVIVPMTAPRLSFISEDILSPGAITNSSTTNQAAYIELFLTPAAVYSNLRVRHQAAGGHAGLPTSKASFRLAKSDGVTVTSVSSLVADPSATVGAYEAAHNVDLPLSSFRPVAGFRYFLEWRSENGTNALAGGVVSAVQMTGACDRHGGALEPIAV